MSDVPWFGRVPPGPGSTRSAHRAACGVSALRVTIPRARSVSTSSTGNVERRAGARLPGLRRSLGSAPAGASRRPARAGGFPTALRAASLRPSSSDQATPPGPHFRRADHSRTNVRPARFLGLRRSRHLSSVQSVLPSQGSGPIAASIDERRGAGPPPVNPASLPPRLRRSVQLAPFGRASRGV